MHDYVQAIKNFKSNARNYLAFTFLTSLYIGIYNVIFNLYIIKLGYNEQFLGMIMSAAMIATGLFAFPAAQICERIGIKKSLLISGALNSITLYMLFTVTSGELLLVLSVLNGVVAAIPTIIAAPFLTENSDQSHRIHLFSFNFAIFVIATVMGMSIGGYLPHACSTFLGINSIGIESYRYTLFISLFVATMSILPLAFIKDRKKTCMQKNNMGVLLKELAKSPSIRNLVIVSCLIGLGAGLIVPFFNVYFNKILLADTGEIGIIFSLAQASMVVGAMAVPYLVNRIGKVKTVSLTYLVSIPFLLIMIVSTNLYMVGAAYILRMMFMNMSMPISNSFSMEIVKEEQMASVSSLTSMGNYVSIAVSTLIAGAMMSHGSYIVPYLGTCALYAMAAILYFKFFRHHEKDIKASAGS